MAKGVRSARGEIVDFDLLRIKQEIAAAPKPTTVAARENFIDQKFKRRLKRLKKDATQSVLADQTASDVNPTEADTPSE